MGVSEREGGVGWYLQEGCVLAVVEAVTLAGIDEVLVV
mgnify:CR=1 FL=1